MLVIVKSSPDTADGKRGIKLAKDMAADIVLVQNAVYFSQGEGLEGFCGAAYCLDDDARLRGLKEGGMQQGVKRIDYGSFVDLMASADKVVGMF